METVAAVGNLETKFQRDLNRTLDNDRNTRKRGLQKLFEDLPWGKKSQKDELTIFVSTALIKTLLPRIADPVEKCRELTLGIIKKCLEKCKINDINLLNDLTVHLVNTINDVPFPETAEELRLAVLEILLAIKLLTECFESFNGVVNSINEQMLQALVKVLTDSFPAAKRAAAELFCSICSTSSSLIRTYYKQLLKTLIANASHQHSKTRSITLQAISHGLTCLAIDDFQTLLKEPILSVFLRCVSDRTASVRVELSTSISNIISARLRICQQTGLPLIDADIELVVVMLLLHGDATEEVAESARTALIRSVTLHWYPQVEDACHAASAMDTDSSNSDYVEDAEIAMKEHGILVKNNSCATATVSTMMHHTDNYIDDAPNSDDSSILIKFLQKNMHEILLILQSGVESWTTDSRKRYLRALDCFIKYVGGDCINSVLPRIFVLLSHQIKDEDTEVRVAAEICCMRLGDQTFYLDCQKQPALGADVDGSSNNSILNADNMVISSSSSSSLSYDHITTTTTASLLDILLPRIQGTVSGGDTASQRANAISVLTHVLKGMMRQHVSNSSTSNSSSKMNVDEEERSSNHHATAIAVYVCRTISSSLSQQQHGLYLYRDASIRESILLLVRAIISAFPAICCNDVKVQRPLLLALLFQCSKCPGEEDVVSEVAQKELQRFSILWANRSNSSANNSYSNISAVSADVVPKYIAGFIGVHFLYLLQRITSIDDDVTSTISEDKCNDSDDDAAAATVDHIINSSSYEVRVKHYDNLKLQWQSDSPAMAAFVVLIRQVCAASDVAWCYHRLLMPIFTHLVQPTPGPVAGSAEANAISYAAQRGEDYNPIASAGAGKSGAGLVDVRLNLLALLEGMIRAGTANWECSRSIAAASQHILQGIVVPNLIWRVGRVEATVRKVALAVCYGILKAGAVGPDTLFHTASAIVPLLVSHLDDNELTPRQMACLCLTVVFERLRGSFSEQSIHEIYPKLVARLDDSSDSVRVSICATLVMFLQCAVHKHCYSSTTLDYTLDQLFIHLDDPDPVIQTAILPVILQAANLDKSLVLKKASVNRCCHRTPAMCDKVTIEVQGFEILEDDN